VSDESKDLISKLLVVDPQKRLSSHEMLAHSWFTKFDEKVNSTEKTEHLDLNILSRLREYRGVSRFNYNFRNFN